MNSVVKKSLAAPIKQISSLVSGGLDAKRDTKRDTKRDGSKKGQAARRKSAVWRSMFRRKSVGRRKSAPCLGHNAPDSWMYIYQAELQRERKLRDARVAKRNAERAVGKTYFRSQHCLRRTSNAKRPAGKLVDGKAVDESFFSAFQRDFQSLHNTSNARRPAGKTPIKTPDTSLFGAFEGLSLDGLTGGTQALNGDQCKVM